MEEIRKSAKTVDDAIAAALAELGAAREEVDITVIDEGSKGFLGMFGSKDAVVLVKKNFNPEKEAETFLKEVFLSMGLIVKIKTEQRLYPNCRAELNLATKKPIRLLQAQSRRHKRCITVNRTAKDLFQIFILI